jgi:peptidoglycan/xylan/chitin deacetylase (PgdA/CDA1 family)
MSYLAKNFTVVSLSRLLDQIDQGVGVQQRTVAITFDDGYRDNYLYAHPILKQYGLPAAVFVATGYTDALRFMWNDRIADAIKRTKRRVIHLELPGETLRFTLDSERSKLAGMALILEKLKTLPEAQKNLVVDDAIRQLGCATCASDRLMLDWTELRTMVRSGWEVGSHTVEHQILTKVSAAETTAELMDSKTALEQHLQIPITTFAYPNGKQQDFDEGVKNSVRAAGYRAALTTVSGLNMDGLDPFAIKRISPWEEQLSRFAVKLEWMFWNCAKNVI